MNDRAPLSPAQRLALAELLGDAFLMLRAPGYRYYWTRGKSWDDLDSLRRTVDRSVAIAEAFHETPRFLVEPGFSFDTQELFLREAAEGCPDDRLDRLIEKLRRIRALE